MISGLLQAAHCGIYCLRFRVENAIDHKLIVMPSLRQTRVQGLELVSLYEVPH